MDPITAVLPPGGAEAAAAAAAKSKPPANDSQNQFLKLLVAQLKGQNPLDPMDGTAFVAQLAQFSSLEELTKIHAGIDVMQQVLTKAADASAASAASAAANNTPATTQN